MLSLTWLGFSPWFRELGSAWKVAWTGQKKSGILEYVVFCDWFVLLSIMFLRSIHIVAYNTSFIFSAEYVPLSRCFSLFIHSLTEARVNCLQVLASMNKAAVNS